MLLLLWFASAAVCACSILGILPAPLFVGVRTAPVRFQCVTLCSPRAHVRMYVCVPICSRRPHGSNFPTQRSVDTRGTISGQPTLVSKTDQYASLIHVGKMPRQSNTLHASSARTSTSSYTRLKQTPMRNTRATSRPFAAES